VRKLGVLAVVVGLLAALTACTTTESATNDCLARPNVIDLGDGPRGRFPPSWYSTPDGSGIDARGITWAIQNAYPVTIEQHDDKTRNDLCLVGGDITSLNVHETTPWATWHGTSALTVKRPNFQALQTVIHNVGDGARFTGQATNWTMRGVHMTRAHDDCIENDGMNSGTVDDSFFDGCYVFYSARRPFNEPIDGSLNTFSLTNSLVRLEHMPFLYDGTPGGGHGPFFKLSANESYGVSPKLVIKNTVFRADEVPYNGGLGIPGFDHDNDPETAPISYLDPANCSNNTMVWLGEGEFPTELPDCFTLTTDRSVWDAAVADWHARRP
jgi:hypothetical protein